MIFSSLFFLFIFFPVSLGIYYLTPRKAKNVMLVLISLVFYAWGTPEYIVLMLFSVVFNYCAGIEMENLRENGSDTAVKVVMILTVTANLLVLGFFKYWGFLVGNLNRLPFLNIAYRELPLPIGISFYTFGVLAYVFDVYRQKVTAQRNFILFATFVTFFPKVVSGPIVTYQQMEDQLRERQISFAKLGQGATLFMTGLFKKILIADNLSTGFYAMTALPGDGVSVVTAWLAVICYSMVLYFDFSSYSDMAIGLGKMFGFEMSKNFDYPYLSTSITEFWRRWHISLGSWFRDYVYFPLGGSRVSTGKNLRNLLVVWLLTGIWHGSAWTFVIWGLIHGAAQILEKFPLKRILEKTPTVLKWLGTMIVVNVAWVFFFSPTFGEAISWVGKMIGIGGAGFLDSTAKYYLSSNWLLLVIAILGCGPLLKNIAINLFSGPGVVRKLLPVAFYTVLMVLCIGYLMNATYSTFLYAQF